MNCNLKMGTRAFEPLPIQSRHHLCWGVGVCLLAVSLIACPRAGRATAPNFVLILADDLAWHDLGCYGNQQIHTPHIDQLAEGGLRFTYAFTGTAMCAPSRQQLYTGVYPVRNGAYPNHSRVYRGTRSIAHHLKDLGYRVGLCGKKHFGPAESFPFDELTVADIPKFVGRDSQQPFLLIYTSNSPHLPWQEGDADQYSPQKLTLPPYLVDTPETRESLTRYYAEITDLDREVGLVRSFVDQSGQADNTLTLFSSEQGPQFPHCKWTCYDSGLRTAFIAHWPGKISPSTTDAMVHYVDVAPTLVALAGGDSEQVDTGLPGGPQGGQGFDGRSFDLVLTGQEDTHREYIYGIQTTRGIIRGSDSYPIRSIRTRSHKLIWNLEPNVTFKNVLIAGIDKGGYWKSWLRAADFDPVALQIVGSYQKRPEFELYDLEADPYELNNLAATAYQPGLAELKVDLIKRLKHWMNSQGDQGIETELAAKTRQGKQKQGQR